MMQSRHRGTSKKGPRQPKGNRTVIPRPLQIPSIGLMHNVKCRFVSTAAVGLRITYGNILDSWLVATTSTLGYQLFDCVKVRAVEVWSYNPSGVTTVTVLFSGTTVGMVGDQKTHTDTSMGIEPAYVKARPSKGCAASLFQPNSSNVAFDITCPIASVVDLHLTFRTGLEGQAPVAVTQALVAAIAGQIYLRGFDGAPVASSKLTPLGTPQII